MTQSLAGEEPVLTSGLGHGGQGGGGDQDLLKGAQSQEDAVVPGKAGEGREEDGGEEEKLITQSWNCNILLHLPLSFRISPALAVAA